MHIRVEKYFDMCIFLRMEKKELEIRRTIGINASGDMRLSGLVNRSGEWSQLLGIGRKFKERIDKGAFDKAIKVAKTIDLLEDHSKKSILATTTNKSLELWEDNEGLKFRATLNPTNYGEDIYQLVKANVINHMSFGFRVIKDSWDTVADGTSLRAIRELELTEISVVRNPAYLETKVEARELKTNDREKEKMTDKEFNKQANWKGQNTEGLIKNTKNLKGISQESEYKYADIEREAKFRTDLFNRIRFEKADPNGGGTIKFPKVVINPNVEIYDNVYIGVSSNVLGYDDIKTDVINASIL